MRTADIVRKTAETSISLQLNIDGQGTSNIATGVGFFDHMLTLLAKHSFFDVTLQAQGDLEVDAHHTVEDCGIVLGQALQSAIGDKQGIKRYGNSFVPMDEALAQVVVDFSGRSFLSWQADIHRGLLGNFETELVEEFFRAVATNCGLTLHVRLLYGKNTHHMIEAIFKATARALAEALTQDERIKGVLSSKGLL